MAVKMFSISESKTFLKKNEDRRRPTYWLKVTVPNMTLLAVSVITVSFLFCVVWSLAFHFDVSTSTHCKVFNFLPSFSSAIGRNWLPGLVWKAAIVLHALPHLCLTRLYHSYNKELFLPKTHFFVHLLTLLSVTENVSLVGLSFVNSDLNYRVHQNFFLVFMVSSEAHMVMTFLLAKYKRRYPPNELEGRSLRSKRLMLALNIASFILASYFFIRHARYCEPVIFSLFSFFEYCIVFANMGFHLSACWDFKDIDITITLRGVTIGTDDKEKQPYKVCAGS